MNKKERMIEILNDTINHYNKNNRSVFIGSCTYIPQNENSEGCAIGRLLPQSSKDLIIEKSCNFCGVGALINKFNIPLGEKLEGLSLRFLSDLQTLHDSCGEWDENGLIEGSRQYKYITDNIELGTYL